MTVRNDTTSAWPQDISRLIKPILALPRKRRSDMPVSPASVVATVRAPQTRRALVNVVGSPYAYANQGCRDKW
jgi:hypothetical protein